MPDLDQLKALKTMEESADVEHNASDALTAKRKEESDTKATTKRRKTARLKPSKLCDYFEPTGLLESSNDQVDENVSLPTFRFSKNRADAVQQLADSAIGNAGFNQAACKRHQNLVYGSAPTCFLEDGTFRVPGMETTLPVYQLAGCAFMLEREQSLAAPRGGICADAMGLGKTVQILACAVNDWESRNKRAPTLIVVKANLVKQWYEEIEKHCQAEARGEVLSFHAKHFEGQTSVMKKLQENNFIITTYNEVMDSHAAVNESKPSRSPRGLLHRMYFHRIVLDEIQQIKNGKSKTSLACVALKGSHCWGLSATPISNRVNELWPIFRFLGLMWTEDLNTFRTKYEINHQNVKDTGPLQRLLNEIMIHRNYQTEIAGRKLLTIPPPSRQIIQLRMTKTEQAVYAHTEACMRAGLAVILTRTDREADEQRKIIIIQLLLYLRRMSTHLLMQDKEIKTFLSKDFIRSIQKFSHDPDEKPWIKYITKLFEGSSKRPDLNKSLPPDFQDRLSLGNVTKAELRKIFSEDSWMNDTEAPLESAKVKVVNQQVQQWIDQEPSIKILIFTLFLQSSEIIQQSLKRNGIQSRLYNGKQSHSQRAVEKAEFDGDSDIHVLIATMQSMSLGLNCQNASAVLLVDRWWNSTVEEQAIGRAYRMNQTKSVQICDLVCLGSFDERIVEMQNKKRSMIREVFGNRGYNDKSLTNNGYMDLIGSENNQDDISDADAQAYADALLKMGKNDAQRATKGDRALFSMESNPGVDKDAGSLFSDATDDDSALFDMESSPVAQDAASDSADATMDSVTADDAASDERPEPEDDDLDQLLKSNVGVPNGKAA